MRRKNELIQILKAGGFELDKWATNEPRLMTDERVITTKENSLSTDNVIKTLGVFWNSERDVFGYRVNFDNTQSITRRTVLSHIARMFDPCGWISPVVIVAKIFLQRLWTEHDSWDTLLNPTLAIEWNEYVQKLSETTTIEVPRWLCMTSQNEEIQVHGFCDSSERAYAACVYLRVKNVNDTTIMLITAKTKVAPVKTISLPRLELCGAVLLAKLMTGVVRRLNLENVTTYSWTDASIVLAWLRGHPSRWKSFIANRVSDIHGHLPNTIWRHVKSNDNPADLATRGVTATSLKDNKLWWHGPCWLQEEEHSWPVSKVMETNLEERNVKAVSATCQKLEPWDLLERWSSYRELQRVTAWLQRFVYNATNDDKRTGNLTTEELSHADEFWIQHVQTIHFGSEQNALRTRGTVSRKSSLFRLHPFFDDTGIIRLGERLANSALPYAEIYPAILPNNSKLTDLLILRAHLMSLHGGTQLTLSVLHRTFWITNGKRAVNRIVRNCVNCFRYRAQPLSQLMGPLPQARCRVNSPFSHTGIDYAGPIQLRTTKGRGHKSYKGYIVLFICLTVRAIHLEVVSDLTTEAFLATFRRFTSRRGLVNTLYTDNATYFQGAKNNLTAQGIKWIFIPPRAPHWGGIWEAGVKSVKHHLRRVLGNTTLTFEELTTLLTQIEACLNSRPLGQLSTDPNDYTPLTPGHFLIGRSFLTPPEPTLLDKNPQHLTRWKLVQHMMQNFWRRWRDDHLRLLQQRSKWQTDQPTLHENDLVLIRDDQLPPTKWKLGRIVRGFPGPDGRIRAAEIRTADNVLTRSVTQLSRLPVG